LLLLWAYVTGSLSSHLGSFRFFLSLPYEDL